MIPFGPVFTKLKTTCQRFVNQIRTVERTPLISILLSGQVGSGKTALAATLAQESKFPFIKLITPEKMVGFSESSRVAKINGYFDDAYKSPLSLVVIDNIERLLDYVRIGPRFSNTILQALFVMLKRLPPKGRRLLIIGTSSKMKFLDDVGLTEAFNAVFTVPNVKAGKEVGSVLKSLGSFTAKDIDLVSRAVHQGIPIKKLLMIGQMSEQGNEGSLAERFVQGLHDFGVD